METENKQSGQVLLILVLLMATIMTVIITASYRTITQTQTTKIQEETVKTLAAADSALEIGLSKAPGSFTFREAGMPAFVGIDPDTSKIFIESIGKPKFVSPTIEKDQQFTFYLSDYPNFTNPSYPTLRILFNSRNGDCETRTMPALELTLVYGNSNTIRRWVVEPCGTFGDNYVAGSDFLSSSQLVTPIELEGRSFAYATSNLAISNATFSGAKVLIVRVLYGPTELAFEEINGASFKIQGRDVKAEAKSFSGITQTASIFQSYPQLSSDFFVTSF